MRQLFVSALLAAVMVALAAPADAATPAKRRGRAASQSAVITVTGEGYSPGTINLRRNVPARITFIRTSEVTCGGEVVFPALGIRRVLPLGEPVVIRFTPRKSGRLTFVCGMDMWRGSVVVQ
jgi:plastocyanin domain-containing protein